MTMDSHNNFCFNVQEGNVRGYRADVKFGHNRNLSVVEQTIWSFGGIVTYPSTALALTLSSESVNDVNITGTGAWIVRITGLDANYNEIEQDVALNGQNAVAIPIPLIRVYRAKVISGALPNIGNVHIGFGAVAAGIPATTYTFIDLGEGITHQGFFTVPAGETLRIKSFEGGSGKTSNEITFNLLAREFGSVFLEFSEYNIKQNRFVTNICRTFPEKTDVEIRAITSAGTARGDISMENYFKTN